MRPCLEFLYNKSVEHVAGPGDQLFNISRFTGALKETSDNMDHPPLCAFFRRLSKERGFSVSLHRFRHTIDTNLMSMPDRNIKMAQELLGHSTPTVTLKYVETDLNKVRKMPEQMEAA
ncbi:site-specific integrase [Kosakonia sp.]|uniref:site-specific integrase n=1 Tax=Kosakonia sp. TaxID=1916651 RepID=UPI00390C9084